MPGHFRPSVVLLSLLAFAILISAGCGPDPRLLNSNRSTPAPAAPVKSSLESDLETMKTADFEFIWIFRRTDGGEFDSEDLAIFRQHTAGVNRRVTSDEGKALVVGSNSPINPESMKILADRFAIEDYSKTPPAVANSQ